MSTSRTPVNGNGRGRFRRTHRWVGISVSAFVLFLALTGIPLNHSTELGLDQRYVGWSWLLDAYGVAMPAPSASYTDQGREAVLVGERVFLDGREIGQRQEALAGIAVLGPIVVIAGAREVHVLTAGGELIESIDLSGTLPGRVERIGRSGGRAVLHSDGRLYRSDPDVAAFDPWDSGPAEEVEWSDAAQPDAVLLETIEAAWRGRGLTIERVLLDLHSGRIFALPGRLLLDLVAVGMVLLGVTGLSLAIRRRRNAR